MRLKQLVILTIATLCCTAAFAQTNVSYKDSIQNGDNYLFVDELINLPGDYSHTFTRVGLPDSTINLSLKFFTPCTNVHVAYTDSVILGDSYLFVDELITPSDMNSVVVEKTIPRLGGCDSTITLTLKVLPVPGPVCEDVHVAYTDSVILGDSYLFVDELITPSDMNSVVVEKTIPRLGGCDSIITLTLKVLPVPGPICTDTTVAYTDSIYVGDTYLFIDTLIAPIKADTVTCQRVLPREGTTCDSTINLTLIATRVQERDTLRDTINANLCYKEAFTDRLGVTYHPTQDTVVLDTLPAARFDTTDTKFVTIDSIYRYELKVWPAMTTTTQTDSLCADYEPFTWHLGSRDSIITDFVIGENHREYMYQNILGCDSAKFILDVDVWPAMTTTTQTDSLCAVYDPFTWHLGSRDSIITDFVIGENHREYMYQNILGCDSAKFILDVDVWPAMTTTTQTDSLCADYEPFTWHLGSRDSIITDFVVGPNHREYMYPNILGCDSAKFILDVRVWPATKYPAALKDTIDEDKFPYTWNVYEGYSETITEGGQHFHHRKNILNCDSIVYELNLAVRTVKREVKSIEDNVCAGTDYVGRLTTHTINGLTEWQDSLRVLDNDLLLAIDSIYTYSIDTLPTRIPDDEISQIKAFCDYPVDYAYAWLNVAEFVNPSFIFAQITDTIWEVETHAGWKPAATTILTSDDETVRVRCTVVTECETTVSTSQPYEVKMATADDKEELTIPASQKYGSRIIMIDKNATETLGWTIPEADVTWYQVVGDRDDHGYNSNPATWDDKKVEEGMYYFTLTDGAPIQGQFYATITGALKPNMTCGAELRTPVIVCNEAKAVTPILAPTLVNPNEAMTLSGLNPNEHYTIRVIAMDGSYVNKLDVNANEAINLKAASIQGMYIVNVQSANDNVSLKYIVK